MSASEPDRAMTPYHLFESKDDEPVIPGPPLLPTDISPPLAASTKPPPSPLDQFREQLASVHDALHAPDGLLHTLFANLLRVQREQHEETMRTLTTLANGLGQLSHDVATLKPKVEEHDAELRLVALHGEPVAATGAE
jgi:hypothetical protein